MITHRGIRDLAMARPAASPSLAGFPGDRAPHTPSSLRFVATVILGAIGVVLAVTLVAAAPGTVTIPIALALLTGLAVSGAVARVDRRSGVRRSRATHATDVPTRSAGRAAVAASSVALLALALVVTGGLGVAITAAGFVGLFALRLSAPHGHWARRRSYHEVRTTAASRRTRDESREPAEDLLVERDVPRAA